MKKNTTAIIAILATLILGGIAIFVSIRLNQLGQQPVAPNVPGSTPSAAEPATVACQTVTFAIATPSATPTPAPGQCPAPSPINPPTLTCATCATCLGSATWKWSDIDTVNQYEVDILDSAGAVVTDNGWQNESVFGCTNGTCTYTTNHRPGSYQARIKGRNTETNVCTESSTALSAMATISICSASATPTASPTATPTQPPSGGVSTPTPTPTPSPTVAPTQTPTSAPTAQATPVTTAPPLPVTGASLPAVAVIFAGIVFLIIAVKMAI